MEQRDLLLESTSEVLQQLHRDEPRHDYIIFLGACVASIQNDLPGMLRELETAVEYGFRNHWELIRNPVFARWQDNDQFKAFHQDMLKTAARMRREYMANNPVEKPAVVTEVFN